MRHRIICGLTSLLLGVGLSVPAEAALIVGFEFAGGATSQVVPTTGGTYVVNVVASTTNQATTNLGVSSGYYGALSQVLNSSLIGGAVTARTIIPGLGNNLGPMVDRNADGRIDLGWTNGSAKTVAEWVRPTSGSSVIVFLGAPKGVIGTFTVTIPAYAGGDGANFLSYIPQINPGGLGSDWGWTETGAANADVSGEAQAGTGITFASPVAIPEPSTLALGGMLLAGLAGLKLRRKTA